MNATKNDKNAARQSGKKGDDAGLIKPARQSFLGSLWSSFIAGVVVAAPVGITVALVLWFTTGPMAKLDAFVKRTLPDGGSNIERVLQGLPFAGVVIAIFALMLLGALAKNYVGRSLIHSSERLVDRLPVVRNLYGFFKNVFETALQQSDRSFKEVALIQYPRKGTWAMAFVVGSAKGEVRAVLDKETFGKHVPETEDLSADTEHGGQSPISEQDTDLVSIFVPTVPNPTSGFLLFVPSRDLRILSMSVEEAAKVVFSMGLVVPEYKDPNAMVARLEKVAKDLDANNTKKKTKLFSR